MSTDLRLLQSWLLAGLLVSLAACTAAEHQQHPEPMTTMNEGERTIMGISEEQQQAIAKAREELSAKRYSEQDQAAIDLAIRTVNERTPVSRDSVSNLRVRPIQWPNSSLGCAEPGVSYLQRVIPGYVVSFNVEDKIYSVHIGDGSAVICDRINDYFAERRKRSMSIIRTYEAARVDLAKKLYVEAEQITITDIKQETWPDMSLGCPAAGEKYKAGPVEGLRIKMTCRDREYEYRSPLDGGDFVSCQKIVSCHETE